MKLFENKRTVSETAQIFAECGRIFDKMANCETTHEITNNQNKTLLVTEKTMTKERFIETILKMLDKEKI